MPWHAGWWHHRRAARRVHVYGLQPGPLLFETQPTLVWGLLVSFFIGNVMLLMLNLPLAPVFAQMLRVRYGFLYPIILLTSFIGAYSVSTNMFSVVLVLIFGVLGYVMKELDLPVAPLVLGLVLGPLFEKALVQTSALGQGKLRDHAREPQQGRHLPAAITWHSVHS